MICPKCKNQMRNDLEFTTIWKCNNKKCTIDTIIVTTKKVKKNPEDIIVATFDTAELAKQYLYKKIESPRLTAKGFR